MSITRMIPEDQRRANKALNAAISERMQDAILADNPNGFLGYFIRRNRRYARMLASKAAKTVDNNEARQ